LKGVIDGYRFLQDVYGRGVKDYLQHQTYELGERILVVGGGDSALDAARTALRLTGKSVTIVYRRTEREMPADPFIVEAAKEEGIQFRFLTSPKSFGGVAGYLRTVTMFSMKLGKPDATGRRSPEVIPGAEFAMDCDSVILAVGRGPNTFLQQKYGLKRGKSNAVAVDDHYRTSMAGVFAAGDVTTGETLVVKAMGQGREAAQRIHEHIMDLEQGHVSLFERYYVLRCSEAYYEKMLEEASMTTVAP
jgi:NADPH-dependent glutamate synthase beta subunit-like oxidoreductase